MAENSTAEKTEEKNVTFRIPVALKRDLETISARERRSLNSQVVFILEEAVSRQESAA